MVADREQAGDLDRIFRAFVDKATGEKATGRERRENGIMTGHHHG